MRTYLVKHDIDLAFGESPMPLSVMVSHPRTLPVEISEFLNIVKYHKAEFCSGGEIILTFDTLLPCSILLPCNILLPSSILLPSHIGMILVVRKYWSLSPVHPPPRFVENIKRYPFPFLEHIRRTHQSRPHHPCFPSGFRTGKWHTCKEN